ncbi:MAG: T9SS type A sorting domain-containing protein [Ignavibacteriaceae bacterium]
MKLITYITIFLSFLVTNIYAQDIFDSIPINDVQTVTEGFFPETDQMSRGGQEKTASGILRILVIFVRYKDDTLNTPTWPDYTVLPSWAQTFVDPSTPSNNIYTAKNMSDFFDRCSGGNGSGTLGSFKMIGDVVYVTTLKNESEYLTGHPGDTEVFTEILQPLDNIHGDYNVNFKLYDNWEFMKSSTLYNHEYKPRIGDGKADHVFIFNRGNSRKTGLGAEKTLAYVDFTSNDGVLINAYCGSRVFGFKDRSTPGAVGGPAHEYCHYLLGGGQETGHFDGYNYYPSVTTNIGRINKFALMCAVSAGWMSAYERYRLGWLNPFVVEANIAGKILKDTHLKNEAILIPLRDPYKGSWREFYLIENYHTQRDYAGANPFLVDELFGDPFTHGLLVFHIEDQNYTLPCATKINILCADGKWTWKLLTGASTPTNRNDDLIGKDQPTRFGNFDERHFITMNVGGINYNDYVCLTPRTDYPGARYNRNDFLGDFADFFREGYNDVLTKYSNPGTYIIGGTAKDVGFEITGYNSTTKEYTLSLQVTAAGVTSLKPSKPQNLKVTSQNGGYESLLTWEPNTEPDVVSNGKYKIFRGEAYTGDPTTWEQIAFINSYVNGQPVTSFIDEEVGPSVSRKLFYKISAVDNSQLESVCSDYDWRMGRVPKIVGVEDPNIEYSLQSNFPNPFNPTTIINYSVKDVGFVSLKVFDILGSDVATLVNETKEAGNFAVEFNPANLPSGVYIYTLQVNGYSESKKMLLMK